MSRVAGIAVVVLGLVGCVEATVIDPDPPASQAAAVAATAPGDADAREAVDWERVSACPAPPQSESCSPAGSKHCECVSYLGLAPEGLFQRGMERGDVVSRCVGLMSHVPCPDEHTAYSECSAAMKADGLTAAERVFFSCAARFCDGTY